MDKMVSVLMSIYNESASDINDSVDSILNQSYYNLELIIIVDDPGREDIESIIANFRDNRIRVYRNKKNIGLANSMNKARSYAKGHYLARMDADDISDKLRIEKEVKFLENNNEYDYVCTWFSFVDESKNIIERSILRYSCKNVNRLLPYCNTIHHPTVLMKTEAFDKVQGYRDFPCAQDYDMWLRLYDCGFKVGIIESVLFYYCLRDKSITSLNRYRQFYTQKYARKLHRERIKHGKDSFSKQNYESYMDRVGINNKEYTTKLQTDSRRNLFKSIYLCIRYKFYRDYYIFAFKSRFMKKIIG